MAFRPNWYDDDSPRTSFGRSVQDWSGFKLIAVACVVMYILQRVLLASGVSLEAYLGLHSWYRAEDGLRFNFLFPVQLFTYMLLHSPGDLTHLIWNMFYLWMFGKDVEASMGRQAYLRLFVLGGLVGGVCQWGWGLVQGSAVPTIGASGAVYAVLVLYAFKWPRRSILLFPFFLPVPAALLIGFRVLSDVLGFVVGGSYTAHLAHLGGALLGYIWFRRGDVVQQVQMKRRREKAQKVSEAHSSERREMDRILAKIQASGLSSLDKSERSFLDKRSRELRQKSGR